MRIAYADPPYLGDAKVYDEFHKDAADWNKPSTHLALVEDLISGRYDGWALSLHPPSLGMILDMIPPKVKIRIGAWVKPDGGFRHTCHPAYAWEPVIFVPARRRERKFGEGFTRDWVRCAMREGDAGNKPEGFEGSKPQGFCFWLFDCLVLEPGDEFCDLFPGSGGVTRAWTFYQEERAKFRRTFTFMDEVPRAVRPRKTRRSDIASAVSAGDAKAGMAETGVATADETALRDAGAGLLPDPSDREPSTE